MKFNNLYFFLYQHRGHGLKLENLSFLYKCILFQIESVHSISTSIFFLPLSETQANIYTLYNVFKEHKVTDSVIK